MRSIFDVYWNGVYFIISVFRFVIAICSVKRPLTFSERNGYVKWFNVGKWHVGFPRKFEL